MSVLRSSFVFSTGLLAIPIGYIVNTAQSLNGEVGLFISGTVAMLTILFITYMAVNLTKEPVDPMMYVISIGMFSSVIDVAIGLENDGIVHGIIGKYLLNGEPYLQTPHGTLICYWDGTGHYLMYLIMLFRMAYNNDYTTIGLYWSGSIIHSIIVFITGNFVGEHSIHWSILLNIPFIIVPCFCLSHFLKSSIKTFDTKLSNIDMCGKFIILSYILLTFLAFFRACAILGSPIPIFKMYIENIEPYLLHSTSYPRIQMLVYFFYFIPFYLISIMMTYHGEIGKSLKHWSIVMAGASAQGQFSHIGSTMKIVGYYWPPYSHINIIFWTINLLQVVAPHLFMYFCLYSGISKKKE